MHHQRKLNCLNIKQGDNSYYGIWCICSLLCCLGSIFRHLQVCKIEGFLPQLVAGAVAADGAGLFPVITTGRLHHHCLEKISVPLYKEAKICNIFSDFLIMYGVISQTSCEKKENTYKCNHADENVLIFFGNLFPLE